MCALLALSVLLPVLFNSADAVCTLDGISCCLSEFANIISPNGIHLSEQKVASVCTFKAETVECLDLFFDQCLKNETDLKEIMELVNKTQMFITKICPPTSDFMQTLKLKEQCILNSSTSFQSCYNRTRPKDNAGMDKSATGCCEYKELRNCAVESVENRCGPVASQLVHDEVMNINGVVPEWICHDVFPQCGNTGIVLASSVLYVMCSVVFMKFLL